MNTLKKIKLYEMASSYIKDGKLIKYRYSSNDPKHKDAILDYMSANKMEVDQEYIEYMKKKGNMVIETNGELEIINFEEYLLKLINQ